MAHPGIPDSLAEVLDIVSGMDRTDRMNTLLDYSDRFDRVTVPADVATRPFPENRRVQRCESEAYVWALPHPSGTGLQYWFAVENPNGVSARALAVLLDETCSGQDPAQVAAIPGDIVFDLFGREISMGRGEGLMGMVAMVTGAARRSVQGEPLQ